MPINNVKSIPVFAGARRATAITGMDPENSIQPEQLLTVTPPNPEVPEKPVRRRFTAEYKLDICAKRIPAQDPAVWDLCCAERGSIRQI